MDGPAAIVRAQRPLVHYQSAPHRPQANGKAERSTPLIIEGARASLLQAGLPESWRPLADMHWTTCYNASWAGADGRTPWVRRYGEKPSFEIYPFGALVLMVVDPAGIGPGPGMWWGGTNRIVPLHCILSDGRASRVNVKRV